jgi:hypothetical protein
MIWIGSQKADHRKTWTSTMELGAAVTVLTKKSSGTQATTKNSNARPLAITAAR